MIQYSVVTSIYRDAYLARDCCREVARVLSTRLGIAPEGLAEVVEFIFVNDGSGGDALAQLLAVQAEFPFVRVVDLSRNFGQHEALACGFRLARGEIVIRLNVDMQDPPDELPKLLDAMADDACDMVIGEYKKRKSPLADRLTAWAYFYLFKYITGLQVPQHTSPMRVMNRSFIDAYNTLTEHHRFPQGLDQWLGFRQKYVEIEHRERSDGRSSYTFASRSALALTGLLYFTDRPLKLIGAFGIAVSLIGVALGTGVVAQKLTGVDLLPGFASIASLILFGFGAQIGSIGILGLYIAKVFREVQGRPLYVTRKIF